MIGSLLTKEECRQCRLCCCFDRYDLWATPEIDKALAQKLGEGVELIRVEDHYLMKMKAEGDSYPCPLLDKKTGCILGDEKPFDCRIWPFRLMEFQGRRVLALSPDCPVVRERPMSQIRMTAEEIAEAAFRYADDHSYAVKKYLSGCVIVLTEKE